MFHFLGKAEAAAQEAWERIVTMTPTAGFDVKGRGLTTKHGVEAQSLTQIAREMRDGLREVAQMPHLDTLFPGLHFDEETVTYHGEPQPVAGASAVVDTAGQLSRRPTLSRVAIGSVLFGALGAIGGGLMQKKEDTRQVFILIDGTKYAWAVPVNPDRYADAQSFAARFNSAAKASGRGRGGGRDRGSGGCEPASGCGSAAHVAGEPSFRRCYQRRGVRSGEGVRSRRLTALSPMRIS